jgi:broad specificity phosphatase PhoE
MSKPKRIILIRHGQSEGNVDHGIYMKKPDYALELTPKGKQQAYNAGLELAALVENKPVVFYSSPYWRTRQTYQEIRKNVQEYRYYEDPRLREQEWMLQLMPKDYTIDQRRDAYGHFYYRIEGGESCADVYDRMSDFMNTMYRDFEKPDYPENVIIVNHGMSMRIFLMRWFHMTVEDFELLANPRNCEYIVLELQSNDKYALTQELRKYESYNHDFQFDWKKQ